MEISLRRIWPPAESAKSAAHDANVGEIQIPVHYVGDAVADSTMTELVRDFHERQKVFVFHLGQGQPLFRAQIAPRENLFQGLGNISARHSDRSIQGDFNPFGIHYFEHGSPSPRA